MTLLPVAEAQARLLALALPLAGERVTIDAAAGRYAAEDVVALRHQPAAALSAMDGYAIRLADMPGPWRVVGESTPGTLPALPLAAGEAMRIFTGAALPAGADAILIQEEARREGERLMLAGEGPLGLGSSVRRAGNDFAQGAVLIESGDRLTPARIALAALAGHGVLSVGGCPRVALISTGDELVPPGAPIAGVQLPASNALMLAAMLSGRATVIDHGIVRDDAEALAAVFARAASDADVVVTTGGASVGDHDLVKPVLERMGATIDFWRIAMKPGKPLMAGKLDDALVLALPGNPVSAFVTATLFLLPLVAFLSGARDPLPKLRRAQLRRALPAGGPRAEYLRGIWQGGAVELAPNQDSAALASLALADLLIVRAADAPAASAGDAIEIIEIA